MRTGSEQALDSALEYARKGVRINLASHSNYLALGEVCLGKGLTDQAGEAIERGIELNPNDADGLGFLVHALCLQGNPDEAIARIGEATWTNPSLRSERRAQTAMAHFVARRYAESVEAMEGLGDPPGSAVTWYAPSAALRPPCFGSAHFVARRAGIRGIGRGHGGAWRSTRLGGHVVRGGARTIGARGRGKEDDRGLSAKRPGGRRTWHVLAQPQGLQARRRPRALCRCPAQSGHRGGARS